MFETVFNPKFIKRDEEIFTVLNKIIYLLIILTVGFISGAIISKIMFPTNYYHGPNSEDVIEDIRRNEKTKKCYHFEPKIISC